MLNEKKRKKNGRSLVTPAQKENCENVITPEQPILAARVIDHELVGPSEPAACETKIVKRKPIAKKIFRRRHQECNEIPLPYDPAIEETINHFFGAKGQFDNATLREMVGNHLKVNRGLFDCAVNVSIRIEKIVNRLHGFWTSPDAENHAARFVAMASDAHYHQAVDANCEVIRRGGMNAVRSFLVNAKASENWNRAMLRSYFAQANEYQEYSRRMLPNQEL